jgi:hypothetical protein
MMRWLVAYLIAAATVSAAAAGPATNGPTALRVTLECENEGRTTACPTLIRGILSEKSWLLVSPRASSDVVIYVSQQAVGNVDRMHFRLVSAMPETPASYEFNADLDTRGTDDQLCEQLTPMLWRGLAPYLTARFPSALEFHMTDRIPTAGTVPTGSPWGINLENNGGGSWSGAYKTYSGDGTLGVLRLNRDSIIDVSVGGAYELKKQPALVLPDGSSVSLDSRAWDTRANALYVKVLSPHWSIAPALNGFYADPKGYRRWGVKPSLGIEWDLLPPADARGNQVAVAYFAEYATERYNHQNVLHENFAQFPAQLLVATVELRRDKVKYHVAVQLKSQLDHPLRRHEVKASAEVSIQIGEHLDMTLSGSALKRELPGPLDFDPANPEEVSRLAYSEPFAADLLLGFVFHLDPTNGVLNNRFSFFR